jgi:hypothetical protein
MQSFDAPHAAPKSRAAIIKARIPGVNINNLEDAKVPRIFLSPCVFEVKQYICLQFSTPRSNVVK